VEIAFKQFMIFSQERMKVVLSRCFVGYAKTLMAARMTCMPGLVRVVSILQWAQVSECQLNHLWTARIADFYS
jgi:hypothetical protein